MATNLAENPSDWEQLQDDITNQARLRLANSSNDADELKRIGLMLGLFAENPDDSEKVVTASPYQPEPGIAGYETSARLTDWVNR